MTDRRIDMTIERLADTFDSLSAAEQEHLATRDWWGAVVMAQRLRSMERAELEVIPLSHQTMADAYDEVVAPGENAAQALLKTLSAVYGAQREG